MNQSECRMLQAAIAKMTPIEKAQATNFKGGVFRLECADGTVERIVVYSTGTEVFYFAWGWKWVCPELDAMADSLNDEAYASWSGEADKAQLEHKWR